MAAVLQEGLRQADGDLRRGAGCGAVLGLDRWDAAYAPIRSSSVETIPKDLRAAIDANARARKTFESLNRQNLFALTFRTNNMKTPAGRARKIATLVATLAKGETIVPQRLKKPRP